MLLLLVFPNIFLAQKRASSREKKINHFLSFNLLSSSWSKNLIPPFQPPIQVVQTEKLRIAANEHFVLRRF